MFIIVEHIESLKQEVWGHTPQDTLFYYIEI